MVLSVLASAAEPDQNFVFKTLPILGLLLPLGLVAAQSGVASAFRLRPFRAGCLSS